MMNEMRLVGKEKYDANESIKDAISDDEVVVEEKYKGATDIRNFCNYIGFTNSMDAIPLSSADASRRYWTVHASKKTESIAYYRELIAGINAHKEAFMYKLMHYTICKEFDPDAKLSEGDDIKAMV